MIIEQKNAPKKVIKKESTLTPSSGQTVQAINPGWDTFRQLILLAID